MSWRKSIQEELDSHRENTTWEVDKPAENVKLLTSRWIFKPKTLDEIQLFKKPLFAKFKMKDLGSDWSGEIELAKASTDEQQTDCITKDMAPLEFLRYKQMMSIDSGGV